METTKVVRLKRVKGKIVQDCDVYIGRQCHMGGWNLSKSKWSNPFPLKESKTRDECLQKYKTYILNNAELMNQIEELRNKTLGCWCAPEKCHGDVLIEILNEIVSRLPR